MSWHAWMGMSVTMGFGIRLGMMSLEIAPQSKHRRNERLGEKCRNEWRSEGKGRRKRRTVEKGEREKGRSWRTKREKRVALAA